MISTSESLEEERWILFIAEGLAGGSRRPSGAGPGLAEVFGPLAVQRCLIVGLERSPWLLEEDFVRSGTTSAGGSRRFFGAWGLGLAW